MGKFKETKKRLFHPNWMPDNVRIITHYPSRDEDGKSVSVPVNAGEEEPELTEGQLRRIDEIYNAAYDFVDVLVNGKTVKTVEIPWSMYTLGELVETACQMILTDPMMGVEQIYFPAITTDVDGNQSITEYYFPEDYLPEHSDTK